MHPKIYEHSEYRRERKRKHIFADASFIIADKSGDKRKIRKRQNLLRRKSHCEIGGIFGNAGWRHEI